MLQSFLVTLVTFIMSFLFFKNLCLLMAIMGLCFYMGFSLVVAGKGAIFIVVCRLFIDMAFLATECRPQAHGLQYLQHVRAGRQPQAQTAMACSQGQRAQLFHCVWNLPKSGTVFMTPALAGRSLLPLSLQENPYNVILTTACFDLRPSFLAGIKLGEGKSSVLPTVVFLGLAWYLAKKNCSLKTCRKKWRETYSLILTQIFLFLHQNRLIE